MTETFVYTDEVEGLSAKLLNLSGALIDNGVITVDDTPVLGLTEQQMEKLLIPLAGLINKAEDGSHYGIAWKFIII